MPNYSTPSGIAASAGFQGDEDSRSAQNRVLRSCCCEISSSIDTCLASKCWSCFFVRTIVTLLVLVLVLFSGSSIKESGAREGKTTLALPKIQQWFPILVPSLSWRTNTNCYKGENYKGKVKELVNKRAARERKSIVELEAALL